MRSSKLVPRERASQISYRAMERYLSATGWKRFFAREGEMAIYRREARGLDEVTVPEDTRFTDFADRMADAVVAIAEFEGRSPADVLQALLAPAADVIKVRVEETATADGTIGFKEGVRLFSGSKLALLATAHETVEPRSFYLRMGIREAEDFLDGCRIGQTEFGSYVVNIICPLTVPVNDDDDQMGLFDPSEVAAGAFSRRVVTRFLQSVSYVVDTIERDRVGHLMRPQAADPIVSGNFLEGLCEMQPAGENSLLHVSAEWARTYPAPERTPSLSVIPKKHFRTMEEVAKVLRPATGPRKVQLVGMVSSLMGKPSDEGVQGEIQLSFVDKEGSAKARVFLSADDYQIACNAHRDGQYVTLSGVFHPGDRVGRISEPAGFKLLNPSLF